MTLVARLAAASIALLGSWHQAAALDYPTRPVRLVVGFPAGRLGRHRRAHRRRKR